MSKSKGKIPDKMDELMKATGAQFFAVARDVVIDVLRERNLLGETGERSQESVAELIALLGKEDNTRELAMKDAGEILSGLREAELNAVKQSPHELIVLGVKLKQFSETLPPRISEIRAEARKLYFKHWRGKSKPTEGVMLKLLNKKGHFLHDENKPDADPAENFHTYYKRWKKEWNLEHLAEGVLKNF